MNKIRLGILTLILGLLVGITTSGISDFVQAAIMGGPGFPGRTGGGSSVTETIISTTEADIECPNTDATHAHGYTNESGPDEDFWYSSRVTKLRIYLHDDFMENVDLDTIECSLYDGADNWNEGCDGYADPDIYGLSATDGGTTVELVTGDTSADAIYENYIEWTYGIDDDTYSIELPGYNDYDGDGVIDTSATGDRSMGEYLYFNFDDSITEGSATTTSAVEIQFWYYDIDEGTWYDSEGEDGETGQHWNGHTGQVITNYICSEGICEELTLEIDGNMISDGQMLSTDTLYDSIGMEVEAYDGDGTNMTGDTTFSYEASAYDGSTGTGDFMSGLLNLTNNGPSTGGYITDSTVDYKNYTSGDTIYIEEETNPDVCNITYTLPYCQDLSLINPTTMLFQSDIPYEDTIEIEVDSSYGDAWPFDVTYESTDTDATFDGNYTPHTTTDWEVDYYSEATSYTTVTISAEDDVAGLCRTGFVYIPQEEEIICDYLDITIPTSDISAADMAAGDVEITWESYLTDTNVNTGPFRVYSSNSSGEFYDSPGGTLLSTAGEISSTTLTTVYYTGEDGDTIYVEDLDEIWCADEVASIELEEGPYCEGMQWQGDYPYAYDDGEVFDITTVEGQEAMYDESVVCFDWWVNVFNIDLTWTANLQAELWEDLGMMSSYASGVMSLTVNETGVTTSGSSPLLAALDDPSLLEYTGTICVENFEEGNYLTLDVLGEDACFLDFEFPKLPEGAPVCEELLMDPDGYTMALEDTDAGTIDITIDLGGSDSTWTGNLIVGALDEDGVPGSGDLFYTDGSPSEYSDGHLEIPVSGTSETITLTYVGGLAGDRVTAYIDGEEVPCIDFFEIDQPTEGPVCEYLEFDGDEIDPGEDYETELCLESDLEDQTLSVTYEGCEGEVIEYDGDEYEGELVIEGIDGDLCIDVTFTNVCEDAEISAVIEEAPYCADELEITEVTEELVCIDLSFDTDSLASLEGEDFETELTLNSELEENTLIINYTGCDGDIEVEYDGVGVSGSDILEIPNIGPGTTNFDVTFTDVCEDADISAYIEEAPEDCYDDLETEILEVGEFDKFIFTFNFASEKDSYADEDIFFSHNEDRAFYTLEYDPAGGEDTITFFDEMWDGVLEGYKGNGEPSGGNISMATTKTELTTGDGPGEHYTYSTIEAYGFGDTHETRTEDIKNIINGWSDSEYMSFVPYIKWDNGDPSQLIPACSFDESTGELLTEETCYDEDYLPEDDGQVIIHNASWVEDQDDEGVIRIRYVGVVDEGVNCDEEEDECLTEEFENDASVELHGGQAVLTASARLVSLCSYLVTRNAGDVYLEVDLQGGSDISCIFVDEGEAISSDFRNVDALVILEADDGDEDSEDDDEDTSIPEVVADYESAWDTASICDDDSSSGGVVGNLSSYVCEIVTSVSDLWKSATIEGTTESVVDQATRNAVTAQNLSEYSNWNELYTDLYNQNNPDSGILYYQGSGEGDVVTLNRMTVPEGAWTLIVKDATLKIAGEIDYETSYDPTDVPSIAFVVLGGDIYISKATREMVGVYYTDQAFRGDERSAVSDDLTIYGSVYGYIQPLLDAANYVGSPTLDGGGIVVRYDSRIILNTPPGLSEYVDVNTEQAVN